MFWTIAPNAPNSFGDYVAKLARMINPGKFTTMRDSHVPDDDEGPYMGTIGVFQQMPAIVTPMGPWYPDYQGTVPVSQQQQITAPEPWESFDGFNG